MTDRLIDGDSHLRVLLDAMPAAVFVVDNQLQLLDSNRAAEELLDSSTDAILGQVSGDVLRCLNAVRSEQGCGSSAQCATCIIRSAVGGAERGEVAKRQMATMMIEQRGRVRSASFLITAAPLQYEEQGLILLVLEDISELVELRQLLPMCSYCRKVRDDSEFWEDVEQYLTKHTAMSFSHGVCPDCLRERFPDIAEEVITRAKEIRKGQSD